MDRIEVNPAVFRDTLQKILTAAEPLCSANGGIEFSGSSEVLSELNTLWGNLCSCVRSYHAVLQSDVAKAGELLDSMIREDREIGEVIGYGGGVSDPG